jgi:multiple sugar transport system ATP-binding protein
MATLQLSNIEKTYGSVEVIKGIDLEIADGEFVVFVGPSGCGKSTLLRMIAGLEEISSGDLFIDSERCNTRAPKDRGIAMVFQSYALYPHKTVYQNMAFGLKLAGRPKSEIDTKIREAARILQMEHLLERRPHQLSGGQRQRVAIGRAIVRNPKVFLFDEPLSNLDAALRVSTRRELAKLHADLKATMIYVTHDQVEAMTLADRIVVLDGGVAQQIGSPIELYERPRNLFVAGFIGSPKMNFIAATVLGRDGRDLQVTSEETGELVIPVEDGTHLAEGTAVTLGIRPEHLSTADGGDGAIDAKVELVERLGDQSLLELRTTTGTTIVARAEASSPIKVGDAIRVGFALDRVHLFGTDGQALRAWPRDA